MSTCTASSRNANADNSRPNCSARRSDDELVEFAEALAIVTSESEAK